MMLKSKINNDTHKNLRKLSIQFSLDGFSFCTKNTNQEIDYFEEIRFSKSCDNPSQLLEKIEAIFIANNELQHDFETVLVIHQNELATFVPNIFFDESQLKTYLKYNIKVLQTDFITFDEIHNLNVKNVYIPYVNINNYLFQQFGEFTFKHHLTILSEKLLPLNTIEQPKVFVNVWPSHFDILVVKNENLIFSNVFAYNTKQDFIYYLLFVYEQLKLDPEIIPLQFSGTIKTEDEIYKIAYKYIRHISFLENKSAYFDKNQSESTHNNFILID